MRRAAAPTRSLVLAWSSRAVSTPSPAATATTDASSPACGRGMGGRRPRAARQLPVSDAAGARPMHAARARDDCRRRARARRRPRVRRDAGGSGTGSRAPATRGARASSAGGRNRASARTPPPRSRPASGGRWRRPRRVVVTSRGDGCGPGPLRRGVRTAIAVVEPGTDRAPLARGSGGGPLHLLCVAALVPRKGHELLFHALASIPNRHWRLTCVGSLERDAGMAEPLRTLARTLNSRTRSRLPARRTATTLPAFYAVGRRVRAADALRRLRNGRRRSAGARTARRQHAHWRDRRARRRRRPGSSCRRATCRRSRSALSACWTTIRASASGLRAGARQVRDTLPTWDDAVSRMDAVLSRVLADGRVQRRLAGASRAGRCARALSGADGRDRRSPRQAAAPCLDLAAGTGANVRYLDGFLPAIAQPALASRRQRSGAAGESGRPPGGSREGVETRAVDLSAALEPGRRQPVRRPRPRHGVGAARSRVGALAAMRWQAGAR